MQNKGIFNSLDNVMNDNFEETTEVNGYSISISKIKEVNLWISENWKPNVPKRNIIRHASRHFKMPKDLIKEIIR